MAQSCSQAKEKKSTHLTQSRSSNCVAKKQGHDITTDILQLSTPWVRWMNDKESVTKVFKKYQNNFFLKSTAESCWGRQHQSRNAGNLSTKARGDTIHGSLSCFGVKLLIIVIVYSRTWQKLPRWNWSLLWGDLKMLVSKKRSHLEKVVKIF